MRDDPISTLRRGAKARRGEAVAPAQDVIRIATVNPPGAQGEPAAALGAHALLHGAGG